VREIKIEKLTVNIGVGESGDRLQKSRKVIERLTGRTASLTKARKREQVFNIRKGDTIGAKITLRGNEAQEFLKRAFDAVDLQLNRRSIDQLGNFSFGIREYIDFPGAKYDPTIGIIGFDIAVTMMRAGRRVALRRRKKSTVPLRHRIKPEETVDFLTNNFKVNING